MKVTQACICKNIPTPEDELQHCHLVVTGLYKKKYHRTKPPLANCWLKANNTFQWNLSKIKTFQHLARGYSLNQSALKKLTRYLLDRWGDDMFLPTALNNIWGLTFNVKSKDSSHTWPPPEERQVYWSVNQQHVHSTRLTAVLLALTSTEPASSYITMETHIRNPKQANLFHVTRTA